MNIHFKRLAALISASLAHNTQAAVNPEAVITSDDDNKSLNISVLNTTVSKHLAAHRSHRSHSSHGSHRSSSGSRSAPTPSYSTPSPSPAKKESTKNQSNPIIIKKSDPLGQPSRPEQSYPSADKNTELAEKLKNEEMRKNIIMRMQLTLQFEGYYNGKVDGIMGPETRSAVMAYKQAKGIPGNTVLDAQTLNAFGIIGY